MNVIVIFISVDWLYHKLHLMPRFPRLSCLSFPAANLLLCNGQYGSTIFRISDNKSHDIKMHDRNESTIRPIKLIFTTKFVFLY